jgi:hypothetical protein
MYSDDPVLLRPLFSPSQNGRLMPGKRRMAVEVTSGGFRPSKQAKTADARATGFPKVER